MYTVNNLGNSEIDSNSIAKSFPSGNYVLFHITIQKIDIAFLHMEEQNMHLLNFS